MKLEQLTEEAKKGTYAGVRMDPVTTTAIVQYCKDNKLPDSIKLDKIHSTLLYSKTYCPNYKPVGKLDTPWEGIAKQFHAWDTQPDDDGKTKKALVLEFECKELVKRHKDLMKEHEASFDFDDYTPHITFSYDIGDMDISKLPAFNQKIIIISEYSEDLDLDWNKNN